MNSESISPALSVSPEEGEKRHRIFLAGAILLLLASAVAFALAARHLAVLPDSVGKHLNRPFWDLHFHQQLFYSRVALLTLFAGLACISLWRWSGTVRVMKLFWTAATHPINLAIYRIVLFGTILFNLDNDSGYANILYFAQLPRELHIMPTGMEHILPYLPINETLAFWTLTIMNVFCVTAIIGLFSRFSALMVLVFGLYALGIPQYFGQTNHYHHMFWFAAVAAAAPIGDYLSVDAILRARRSVKQGGSTEPARPSRAYSLPLRFILILIGICYFFPGLWKYWVSGLAWAFSDNFKHLMEWKWINMGLSPGFPEWKPLMRMDEHAWLYMPSAAIALVFEMGFIVMMFFPRARYLAIAMGVGFHRMTWFMMRIPFYTLQTSYVAAIEWDKVFGWISRKLFARPTTVVFDGDNLAVAKSIATLRAVDLLGPNAVRYIDIADASALKAAGVSPDRSQPVMAFKGDGTIVTGDNAYWAAAKRNPVLWLIFPILPLLWSDARPQPVGTEPRRLQILPSRGLAFVTIVFAIVLLPNLVLGFTRKYHAWPYACYPLFEKMREHKKPQFEVLAYDAQGNLIAWDETKLYPKLTKPRWATMCRRVREKREPEQMHAFWEMLEKEFPQLKDAKKVEFWEYTILTAPKDWAEPPADKKMLYAAAVKDGDLEALPEFQKKVATASMKEDPDE